MRTDSSIKIHGVDVAAVAGKLNHGDFTVSYHPLVRDY